MLQVPYLCDGDAVAPQRSRQGDAGYDLCSTENVTLKPFERALIPTGLHIELPEGFAAFVLPRSGLAINKGLSLVNSPGLIDSNYRGEIKAIAINLDSKETIVVQKGDRIAQLVIQKVEDVTFVKSERLEDTERGEKGFGSSGVSSR